MSPGPARGECLRAERYVQACACAREEPETGRMPGRGFRTEAGRHTPAQPFFWADAQPEPQRGEVLSGRRPSTGAPGPPLGARRGPRESPLGARPRADAHPHGRNPRTVAGGERAAKGGPPPAGLPAGRRRQARRGLACSKRAAGAPPLNLKFFMSGGGAMPPPLGAAVAAAQSAAWATARGATLAAAIRPLLAAAEAIPAAAGSRARRPPAPIWVLLNKIKFAAAPGGIVSRRATLGARPRLSRPQAAVAAARGKARRQEQAALSERERGHTWPRDRSRAGMPCSRTLNLETVPGGRPPRPAAWKRSSKFKVCCKYSPRRSWGGPGGGARESGQRGEACARSSAGGPRSPPPNFGRQGRPRRSRVYEAPERTPPCWPRTPRRLRDGTRRSPEIIRGRIYEAANIFPASARARPNFKRRLRASSRCRQSGHSGRGESNARP